MLRAEFIGKQIGPTSITGFVESKKHTITSKKSSKLEKLHVKPGDIVQKGTVLAELSNRGIDLEIKSLKLRIDKLKLSRDSKIKALNILEPSLSNGVEYPIEIQSISMKVRELEAELEVYESEKKDLVLKARDYGTLAEINYKVGEIINPYSPIITIDEPKSSFIRAYIHESNMVDLVVGTKVRVTSKTNRSFISEGRVVGKGSRIIRFPPRLQPINSSHEFWGREIIIEADSRRSLQLGEMLDIQIESGQESQGTFSELLELISVVQSSD